MLLIFGTKAYREILGVVTVVCRYCGNPAAHRLEEITNKFTVFFIPLFTVGRQWMMQCAMCAAETRLDRREAEQLKASATRPHLR